MQLISYSYLVSITSSFLFFFFNDTATTEIYTLSLHDALPILGVHWKTRSGARPEIPHVPASVLVPLVVRSEEHTSELQSHSDLVCRLLLEKKKKRKTTKHTTQSSVARAHPTAPDQSCCPVSQS